MGDKQSTLKPETLKDLCQDTSFSEAEIDQWYKGFVKTSPTGRLTKPEFQKLYCKIFPQGDASAFADHVFRTFDTDPKDGQIDFREFLLMLRVMRKGTLEQRLQWVFNVYDIDGDGFITKTEMLQVMGAMYKMAGENARFSADERTPDCTDRNFDQTLNCETVVMDDLKNKDSFNREVCDTSSASSKTDFETHSDVNWSKETSSNADSELLYPAMCDKDVASSNNVVASVDFTDDRSRQIQSSDSVSGDVTAEKHTDIGDAPDLRLLLEIDK